MDILLTRQENFWQPTARANYGLKERKIEDIVLRRLPSEWKHHNEFPRYLSRGKRSSNLEGRSNSSQDTFLGKLKMDPTSTDVIYEAIPSPEYTPGMFYYFPRKIGKPRDYVQKRMTHCYSAVCPRDQLCRGLKRRIYCEVMDEQKLCFDCNGREIRTTFNNELNNLFPYLEYDQMKRPYGFCPRAIRLTEPLPIREFSNSSCLKSHGNCDCTRTKSALLPRVKAEDYEEWLKKRPFTK